MISNFKKAFTLIELLVVIGVMAVIAAGVVALIDPVDKTRQANDAKVMNDIGQMATAMQAAAAQTSDGLYPATLASLATLGELTVVPAPPTGWAAYALTGGGTSTISICGQLRSKRYTATPNWVFCSLTGKAGAVTGCGVCP